MKKSVNYNLGLDIGTSSIGFAAIDDQGKPVRHGNKTVIGARLFEGRIVKSSVTFYRRKLQTVSSRLRPYGVDYL
ncbi:hypothetical protein, partial [Lactiplantibacillus paraplantarum]|uniref:hypothetical protein n=1 Tax=Lactiplantibacillus paraplantarum TaxID=60520 RepID=UPI0005344656